MSESQRFTSSPSPSPPPKKVARQSTGDENSSNHQVRYLRACDNCRRRKVKCDGEKPSCGHCSRVDAPCHYSIKPKSRRMWKCLENNSTATTATDPKTTSTGTSGTNASTMAGGQNMNVDTAKLLARVETMERLLMQRAGGSGGNTPHMPPASVMASASGSGGGNGSYGEETSSGLQNSYGHVSNGGLNIVSGNGGNNGGSHMAAADLRPSTSSRGTPADDEMNNRRGNNIVSTHRDNESLGMMETASSSNYPPSHLTNMLMPPALASGDHLFSTSNANSHRYNQGRAGSTTSNNTENYNNHYHSLGLPSSEVIKDLINTMFTSEPVIGELLHEKTYRRQFENGTLPPLLLYSSLASAARYSKHPAVRREPPSSAAIVFLNRARQLVVDALEEPSLGNAQGLMLMCFMHFSLGNETIVSAYKALVLNMCIVLGFNQLDSAEGHMRTRGHCNHQLVVASAMAMDWVDREAARRLWWTIFSIENYSSVCMGLAPSINAEYCDVNLPANALEWENGAPLSGSTQAEDVATATSSSSPHQQQQQQQDAIAVALGLRLDATDNSTSPKQSSQLVDNPIHRLTAYHAQLTLIFSRVASLVTRTNSDVDEALSQFAELNSVLQRWYEGLPKELRLSSVDSLLYGRYEEHDYYKVCVLHMRFYATVIQLNHAIPEFSDEPEVVDSGQRKCVIAAARITDLLRTSPEIPVEMRDMNWYMCVFRSAHIHIYRLLSKDADAIARAKQDLVIHRRHLREGGPLWQVCYKLITKLDDMEQMVNLLPAQIPVTELIKLKNLTRKGKSQLVNMQLDSLIKPTHLNQGESNDDVPLITKTNMQPPPPPPPPPPPVSSDAALGMTTMEGFYGLLDQKTPQQQNGSPSNNSGRSSLNPFTPHTTLPSSLALDGGPSIVQQGQQQTTGGGGGGGGDFMLPASVNSLQPPGKLGSSGPPPPLMPPPLGTAAPINTNIVIDNNMAETLVNYFYMVASNNQEDMSSSQQQQMLLGQMYGGNEYLR